MDTGSILIGVLTGLGTGIISSFIFLFLVSQLKPKISISDSIAQGKSVNGITPYRIKVINRTHPLKFINRRGDVINVKAKLELIKLVHIGNDTLHSGQDINLRRPEIPRLSHLDKKDIEEKYAFRFITDEDLKQIWTDTSTQFLRFTISATDSFSNLADVFTQEYKLSLFKPGNFVNGDTFEIYDSYA